jgi:hypothetical protein
VNQTPDCSLKNVSLTLLHGALWMGIILVFLILSLAVFVCISNAVFNLAGRIHTKRRQPGSQVKDSCEAFICPDRGGHVGAHK